ncbi:MAG: hypothetical protein KF868_06255 [Acidobacteria bacterium]|nr:hypothetical protein [Acidobacteriota bacterium]MCW5969782.1 hypothetical protein [Blastocatellales bacterium]
MSALRKRLKRPQTYLLLLAVIIVLLVADSFRTPASQVTARITGSPPSDSSSKTDRIDGSG